ncbi:hypothetical protein GCM10023322_13040 [Rugosimonospora acidiphila]|uniref:Uncharacterized protein n=1 Tax=Rugosimonospora acidiphila TaxID=556531 RepID=A0ABP9RLP8_9ACTN
MVAAGAGSRRRFGIVIATLAAALTPTACGIPRHAQPRAVHAAPSAIRSDLLRKTAAGLCAAENAQEMGTQRLGQLYDAPPGQYLTVQRAESGARQKLRDALAALAATGVDRSTLGRLVDDEDAVLTSRARLLKVLGGQPGGSSLALLTGPPKVVSAYRDVVGSYVAAGRDFLSAGLAACATPMITVLVGPGQDEASAATVEFRIAAACRTVGYVTRSQRPAQSMPGTATLGTVVQPGTQKHDDLYDGSSGQVSPPVGADEAIVLTSVHYPVDSATCVSNGTAGPSPAAPSATASPSPTAS